MIILNNKIMAKKALLMILDGWGMGNHGKGDVIFNTPTPYMDYLAQNYPMSQLQASGENVDCPTDRWVIPRWVTSISAQAVSCIRIW